MKSIILILLVTISCSCSNKKFSNSLSVNSKSFSELNDMRKLKGKVKSIIEKHYSVSGEKKDSLSYTNGVKYNKNGSISEILTDTSWLKIFPKYDENNNEIESSFTDQDGNVIKQFFTYDKNGNNIEDRNEFSIRTFEYDGKGNIVTEITTNKGKQASSSKYSYDSKNNITEVVFYNSASSFKSKHTYEYDVNGNIIKDTFFDTPEHAESFRKYTYLEFDKNGNWKKRIEESKFPNLTEREISYY